MKKRCLLGSILSCFLLFPPIFADQTKGFLFIIGGGKRSESMMKRFIELAQDFQSGKILIFPMASSVPDKE